MDITGGLQEIACLLQISRTAGKWLACWTPPPPSLSTPSTGMPISVKIPKEIKQHNQTRVDNYAWLRDKNWKKFIEGDLDFHDPSVKEYLESEQAYTKQIMDHTQSSQKQIYDEILSRIVEDHIS